MTSRPPPEKIWLRRPGGQTQTVNIPAGATELRINLDGTVTLLNQSDPQQKGETQ
jgi:hypothetical protein